MGSPPATAPVLTVERHDATYLLPRRHPDAAAAGRRLDRLQRRRLPGLLEGLFEGASQAADPGVWLIRRLEVDLSVDLGTVDDERLARAWAGRVAGTLGRVLARGPDGEQVLRFPDQAAYLARFLEDLTAGRAWERWYYRTFDALRSLGKGAAVREALLREPEQIGAVFCRLAEAGALRGILAVLSAGDARRLLDAFFAHVSAGPSRGERRRIEILLAVWPPGEVPDGRQGADKAALGLLARGLARDPGLATDPDLRGSLETLLGLAGILGRLAAPEVFLARLPGDLRGAAEMIRKAGAQWALPALPAVARLARQDRRWLQGVARTVAPEPGGLGNRGGAASGEGELVVSRFAAAFLLLPSFLALGLDEVVRNAVGDRGEAAAAALRHLILVKCFGSARAAFSRDDPGLRFAAGLGDGNRAPEGPDGEGEAGREDREQEVSRLLRAGLVATLAAQRRIDGRCVAAELVALRPPEAILLLRDMERDFWLDASPVDPADRASTARALHRALDAVAQAVEAPAEHLLLGTEIDRLLRDELATAFRGRLLRSAPQDSPDVAAAVERFRNRSRPAAQELACLTLPDLPPDLDLAATLAAHAVLRHFAGRLMGFAWSGAEHLFENFLAGEGTVEVTAAGKEVALPPVPLALVLRMAGMHGETYTVPWLGDTEITLSLTAG